MKLFADHLTRTLTRTVTAAFGVALMGAALTVPATAHAEETKDRQQAEPLVFGHRGASGYRPEHTLASYELAIQQGADYIEPDLVSTKDGVLIARHENEIGGTTDVADHPEFADRRTTKVIDGVSYTGWFTEDFTLAEIKTLRAIERIPDERPQNTAYNGMYEIPTFDEVLKLAKQHSRKGRTIGVAPETKHPTYFQSIDLPLEKSVVRTLQRNGLNRASAKVVIQSFEVQNLKDLSTMTRVPLLQLMSGPNSAPADQVAAGTGVTYADLMTPAGLREISRYADFIGPTKSSVIPVDAEGGLSTPTPLVSDAKRAGLKVVPYTIRAENRYLPPAFRSSADPNEYGDVAAEVRAFADAGVYGIFIDQPDLAVAALDRRK